MLAAGCASAGRVVDRVPAPEAPRSTADVDKPAATPRDPASRPALATGAPCLPPGVASDFFMWPVRSFRAIVIPRDDDTVTAGAWVLYGKGDSLVVAVWGGEELIAVDPSPASTAPIWVDRGRLDAERHALRSDNGRPCQWRRHGERQV